MVDNYFAGIIAGYLGSDFMTRPVEEWKIDAIKEDISKYCEKSIDRSLISYQEKEDQKRQMKQDLEAYINGVKDQLRSSGCLR